MKSVSIKKNLFYQMLYEVLALSLPLITSPYVSRVLGADRIGIYSYTSSIATYFGLFCMWGVRFHGNREISKVKGDKELLSKAFIDIYFLQFCVSILIVLLYLGYSICVSDYFELSLIQLLCVISYMLDINWFFWGLELFKQVSIRNIMVKLITCAATFVFVKEPNDLWKYCLILASGTFAGNVVLWLYLPRYVYVCKPCLDRVKKNIKPMIILFVPILSTSIYNYMDKIMVGSMSSKSELGYYENSEKILYCLRTAVLSVGTVMMPRITSMVSNGDNKQMEKYMKNSFDLIMWIAFAFSFGMASVAQKFSIIYWGEGYSSCGILLIGLSVALPICAIGNYFRMQVLIPHDMDKQFIIATIMGAIFNAIFNTLLIPNYGAVGAVYGTIIAEIVLCAGQVLFAKRIVKIKMYLLRIIPCFSIGLVMYYVVHVMDGFLDVSVFSLLCEIIVGAMVYCTLGICFIYITNRNLVDEIFGKFVKRRRNVKE